MNCIDCSYNLLKDGHCNCTYEGCECIKINVLEKENAELKEDLRNKKLAIQNRNGRIKELEAENAELKERHKSVCESLTNTHRHIREQLTEAREIIKELLSSCFGYNSKTVNYEVKAKAEDFLNSEVS